MTQINPILSVKNLSIGCHSDGKIIEAVKSVSFDLYPGKTLALVGESGSGKSVCALSLLRLLPYPKAFHKSGDIILYDHNDSGQTILKGPSSDLNEADDKAMRMIRGSKIGMIFQEPLTALNPLHTIADQIKEVLDIHTDLSHDQKHERISSLLTDVEFSGGHKRLKAYPHELSGGQRQRVMIAMALAANPKILIADEPTTALDVTTQLGILNLITKLKVKHGLSVLFITHDLSVVQSYADDVVVMKTGSVIEAGSVETIFKAPKDPYTQDLINADPKGSAVMVPKDNAEFQSPILDVQDLTVEFGKPKSLFHRKDTRLKAVNSLSFTLKPGKTLGVVGESGSGKTTLAMAIMRLLRPKHGHILFKNQSIAALSSRDLRPLRKDFQIVFQDPFGSLNPRLTIGQIIGEGIDVHKLALSEDQKQKMIAKALQDVSLDVSVDTSVIHRFPHEFSGGQRQRIAIARALVVNPSLIILDEPTSALDRTVQASVLDLLKEIQRTRGISYVIITHDLRVIRSIAHDMIVMKNGQVIEDGSTEMLFAAPQTEYTKALLSASLLMP